MICILTYITFKNDCIEEMSGLSLLDLKFLLKIRKYESLLKTHTVDGLIFFMRFHVYTFFFNGQRWISIPGLKFAASQTVSVSCVVGEKE